MGVIEKYEGPCVVLAGAGTGKTHTIVDKVKHLIVGGVYKPEKIVCITFSNEAANSLMSRIRRSFESGDNVIVRTFHGFSADLLREFGDKIGVRKDFMILDPDEAKVVLCTNLGVPPGNCSRYVGSIGQAKDLGISIESVESYLDKEEFKLEGIDLNKRLESLQFEFQTLHMKSDREKKSELARQIKDISDLIKTRKFTKTWRAYEKLKKIKNYLDYSDLNNLALELLNKDAGIGERFDYIVIDEFQDTNKVQLDFLKSLAVKKNIMVVGDLNQSIYRFRGAYNKNFEEFRKFFEVKKEDIFNLDRSFRSSNKILRAAHKLICNNYSDEKELFEVKSFNAREGENVEVYEMNNSKEEARKVVELVESEIKKGTKPEEICVIFRTHQYGRVIKQALEFKGVEYCAVSKTNLMKQKSIKTIVDYLNILEKLKSRGRSGEQAWWDLVYQSGFSDEDLIKIGKFIKDNKDSENISALMFNELENIDLSESGKVNAKILTERIKLMIPFISKSLPELVKEVIRCSGLGNGAVGSGGKERMLNLNKFYEAATTHFNLYESDLGSFVYYLNILDELKIEIDSARIEDKGVRLMTLHATKGLEYGVVILTNMAQKRFPMDKIQNNSLIPFALSPEFSGKELSKEDIDYYLHEYERKHQLFDERRLCYVAFTRAKRKLILTYASQYGEKKYYPSQFLNEIKYRENNDVSFNLDSDDKFVKPALQAGNDFSLSKYLNNRNFEEYLVKSVKNFNRSSLKKPDEIVLSPSSLLLFDECQKKFEYKYIYNMPEEKTIHWEAMLLGSFVHFVLELGVEKNYRSVKEFEDLARDLNRGDDWEKVDIDDAMHLIRIFFERNKNKYSENSKTEQKLDTEIDGIRFTGFADRIDFNTDGLEIVDYKTGKSHVPPKARNWQLGYYALAASKLGKVRKITLDMLRHEKPLEFYLDSGGNASAKYSDRMEFNIVDVKSEIAAKAREVLSAYKKGFKPCPVEKNCEFCNQWVYGV